MASSRDRQRRLARAKMERQMVRRAARARRNRQVQAGIIAGAAVILVVLASLWGAGVFSGKKSSETQASDCLWTPADTTANTALRDVGTPPTTGIPKSGTETMTITTNVGVITASLDLAKAPCTSASFKYLASKQFFDNTSCHRLLDQGDYVLQCGDPTGTGSGGPGYTFVDENLPTPASAAPDASDSATATYPAGVLAMANSGADTNGSQFFIVYKDSPFPANYTIFGQVTSGLDVVQKVGDAGDDGAFASDAGGGHPKTAVKIQTMTVSDVNAGSAPPAGSTSPSAPASPAGSASPSAPTTGSKAPSSSPS